MSLLTTEVKSLSCILAQLKPTSVRDSGQHSQPLSEGVVAFHVMPSTTSEPPAPFICIDCGWEIHQFVKVHDNDQPICYTCLWIRAAPEEDREELRKILRGDIS